MLGMTMIQRTMMLMLVPCIMVLVTVGQLLLIYSQVLQTLLMWRKAKTPSNHLLWEWKM